MQESENQWNVA